MSHPFRVVFAMLLAALAAGCVFSPDDSGGGNDPTPGVPEITWISISEGEIVRTRNLTVSWKGNDHARRYRFSLDGALSAWFDSTSYSLSDLAEGIHDITVQAANDSLQSELKTVRFTVDAASGSTVRFSPGTVSGTSYVSIFLDEVSGIMAAHLEIAFPDSAGRMREFSTGDAAAREGVIVIADARNPYRLILDIGFPGRPEGFSGSIELGSFLVSPVKTEGTALVDPALSIFRDTRNEPVRIERFETLRVQR